MADRRPGHGLATRRRYAEFAVTHEDHALPIPEGLTLTRQVRCARPFFTVWSNVFSRGGLTAGESFLVHGGNIRDWHDGDPVGARIRGAGVHHGRVRGKGERCLELGADVAINYREQDFVDRIADETKGRGSISSSTWLAETIFRETLRLWQRMAAWSRSPS